MRATFESESTHDVYSADEVAQAAGVPIGRVVKLLQTGRVLSFRTFVGQRDAVQLVRWLRGAADTSDWRPPPLTLPAESTRRGGLPLVASGVVHGALFAALCLVAWLGLLSPHDTEQVIKDPPVQLVYLMSPGPGGGGGGGGMHVPTPPPPAQRKAPVKVPKKVASPVPPRRPIPPPPPVVAPPPPRVDPPKPIPPPIVQAPVVPIPGDPIDKVGVIAPPAPAAPPSNGPGVGGGAGTGSGPGLGEGRGAGIGPGSGGGTGGGPYQPGTGIEPPSLVREIKPLYTDDARRRAIEGGVVLEIVVRRDGSVGDVHVVHTLDAGLDQRAIDAVRQWRFGPARRQGSPVDVVVEVKVEFKLR